MSMLNAAAELTRRAATASFMVKISLACRRSGMVTMLTKIKVISGVYQTTAATGRQLGRTWNNPRGPEGQVEVPGSRELADTRVYVDLPPLLKHLRSCRHPVTCTAVSRLLDTTTKDTYDFRLQTFTLSTTSYCCVSVGPISQSIPPEQKTSTT
jgi:hypothetical protein